jgi:pyridoxamine 5'-phosphate oxidase-like protein
MSEPRSDRPHVPGYGIPETTDGLLPWSWADERLGRAKVYWLATTGADAAPHLNPIWGSWVDGRWFVEGGPTRWQRNLRENPQMAIHIEFGEEVVIVEGTAREHVKPADDLADRILAGYAKYRPEYEASADHWTEGGLWELTPVKAFAWSSFPADMTRFTFDDWAETRLVP